MPPVAERMAVAALSTVTGAANPFERTAVFSAKPARAGSRVLTAVQVVALAGRLAVLISRPSPSRARTWPKAIKTQTSGS
jgi:hypothetical protein